MSALAASASFGPSAASPLPVTPKKKKVAATPEPTPAKTVARKKPAAVEPVAEPVPEPKAEVVEPPAKKAKTVKKAEAKVEAVAEVAPAVAATGGKVKKTAKKEEAEPKKAAKKEEKAEKGPKRALAAFMFYSNAVRAQTRLDNPTLKITEVASLLGKQWAELSEEAKKPYVAMHEKDKKRYDEEKAAAAAK